MEMRLKKGQRNTKKLIEIKLGRTDIPEEYWQKFFDKTDKGIEPQEIDDLLSNMFMAQRFLALDFQSWVDDFRTGILFLSDFNQEPLAIRRLGAKAYRAAMKSGSTGMEVE